MGATTTQTTDPRGRNTAIDSLRTAMMCVVMFGHPLLPYTTVPRRFEDPSTGVAFDVIGVFLYAFAMPAFFVTAGFAAAGLYLRRGPGAFWRNRASRILAPLLVGYVLLTPLTRAAYQFAQVVAESGSIGDAWQVVSAFGWLRWGKVYHLWFLASLLVFSAGAIALQAMLRRLGDPARARLDRAGRWLALGPANVAAVGAIAAVLMVPSYVTGTGQGTDAWMQLAIFGFFALGWLLYRYRDGLAALSVAWWRGPLIALAVSPLCAWSTRERLLAEQVGDLPLGVLAGVTNALVAAGMSFGLLGAFQRHFSRRGRLGQYVSDASYWIYLIHYPIVIFVGGAFAATAWPPALKYAGTVAISLPIILASYELVVRHSPLGTVLGGARATRRPPAPR